MIDTGSPVSLVIKSIYQKFFKDNKLLQKNDYPNLKGIDNSAIKVHGMIFDQICLEKGVNNSAIKVHGKIFDQICLEKLPSYWFDVSLLIVEDSTITFDVLLGRDFFYDSHICLIYENGNFNFEYFPRYKNQLYIYEKRDWGKESLWRY